MRIETLYCGATEDRGSIIRARLFSDTGELLAVETGYDSSAEPYTNHEALAMVLISSAPQTAGTKFWAGTLIDRGYLFIPINFPRYVRPRREPGDILGVR